MATGQKILFCSPHPLDPSLGAPKVVIEIAAEMGKLGWQCELVSDTDVCPVVNSYHGFKRGRVYAEYLAGYLERRAGDFDVVDYDQSCLPYPRQRFARDTLFVARSVLMVQHFQNISIPSMPGLKPFVGGILRAPWRRLQIALVARSGDRTCREADLVNVSNDDDRDELIRRGVRSENIVVIPFGLTPERLRQFEVCSAVLQARQIETPIVAFVGTFDARKGAREFPLIVDFVSRANPRVKFRLLGAKYRSGSDVLKYFPERLRSHVEVIPSFDPAQLPSLLRDCTLGVFPSHLEGFGFGVLEMLAAALPVVAYKAPGPPMMLPEDYLVSRGDARAMSAALIRFLSAPDLLVRARAWAQRRASDFLWPDLARKTSDVYHQHLDLKRTR